MLRRLTILAVLVACAAFAPAARAGDTPVDIEIAIDTTGSMTPSIANAKRDARKIVAETRQTLPAARFAVVQFRDQGDHPEYQVVQPATGSGDLVESAISELRAGGGGDSPEAYSLVFDRAVHAQDALGVRPGSRKLLFVLGDAEPHGAGAAGLAGCSDESEDPNGFAAERALAGLRAAEITLNLILQTSSAQTTLRCYQSLASAAYGNGTATESGEPGGGGCDHECPPCPPDPGPDKPTSSPGEPPVGIAPPCGGAGGGSEDALAPAFRHAIAREFPALRFTRRPKLAPGETGRFKLRIANRASKASVLRSMSVKLPEGFAYRRGSSRGLTSADPSIDGRQLGWAVPRTLPAGGRRSLSFVLRAGPRGGVLRAAARLRMAEGGGFTARRRTTARVG